MKAREVLVLVMLVACATLARAQGDKATVVGTITDASGAVLPGAEVVLTRVATNEAFSTLTSDTGDYAIRGMVPDIYQLKVSMAGFKTELRSGLRLEIGRTYRMDVPLAVGAPSEQITVQSSAPILKTEAPELGQVIDNHKIMSLPLNRRDVFGTLGSLTPGVQPTRASDSGGNGVQFNVKGLRQSDNYGMIDGSMVSETNGALQFFINPDAAQEFEIKTGLYGAEYGIKPGGQFSLVTKSGTNDLHGSAFWLHRNDNLDARNFFDPGDRPEFKRNQYGAVAGGPMVFPKLFDGRDKAWWFFAYSGESVRRLLSLTGNVPTPDEKAGRFASAITDPLTGQPFPNNTIPANRINPVSAKMLQFWPDPNTTAGRGFNFTSSSNGSVDRWQVLAKIDFKTGPNSRWSGRFLYDDQPYLVVNPIDFFTRTDTLTNWAQNITNTRTFGAKVVNEFGFHWFRRPYFPGFQTSNVPAGFPSSLGINNWPQKTVDQLGVPRVSVTGLLTIGDSGNFGPVPEGNWEVKDNLSWTHGSHFFKTGYHFRLQYFALLLETRSGFSFTNDRYTNNAFANYLLGYVTTAAQGAENRNNVNHPGHHFYFQDSWKVSPKLTLNLGLRYELRLSWTDKRGYLSNLEYPCVQSNPNPVPACYDPPEAIGNPPFPETGRYAEREPLFKWTKNGWQPRIGVAYRLTDNTVLRAGFGIYGNEPPGGMVYGALGGSRNPRANAFQQTFTGSATTPDLLFQDPFSGNVPGGGLPNVGGFEDPMPQWYVPNWGISVEHQLTPNTMFEIGYQGSRSVHEIQIVEINDAVPGTGPRQSRRPFPTLQSYQLLVGNGDQRYDALELKFEKRLGPDGLTTLLAYTWSKSLDTIGGRLGVAGDPGNMSNNVTLAQNRGRGEANIPGRLAWMMGYELPFGKGKPYLTNSLLGHLLGGWSAYGILTLQKGQWFTPVLSSDFLDVGSTASQRPDLLRNANLDSGERTPQRWFDTTAFALPPNTRYGNAGRGILEGPGLGNFDFSLLRSFALSEASRLEFRFEAFNLTNHTNFGLPGSAMPSTGFGVIGSAFEARDLQFGFKLYW